MCTFKILCVTNRSLCVKTAEANPFEALHLRIKRLLEAGADRIILREKDLPSKTYAALAASLLSLPQAGKRLVLHSHPDIAKKLGVSALHLPLRKLEEHSSLADQFEVLGVSVHSKEEAVRAQTLGATYITAGHIFATSCKPGLPPRGAAFLEDVCRSVSVPVYAIGGVTPENILLTANAGASGACIMSSCMTCSDPSAYLAALRTAADVSIARQ